MTTRTHTFSVCILCLALLLAACSRVEITPLPPAPAPSPTPTRLPATSTPGSSPASSASPRTPPAEWHLVVIGDSSLWGLGAAFASRIESDAGVQVELIDFALPSLSAGTVLEALRGDKPPSTRLAKELADDLTHAEVVVMFVNPLDSVDPGNPLNLDGCFISRAPASCSPETFEHYTADLETIWAKILELRAGQPTILRATDIYNPLVSPWEQGGVLVACTECWENMSRAARLAAEARDIPFLSRYDAFNGTNHLEDPREKGYIRDDGEHPTELASQFTAELLSRMGYDPLLPGPAPMAAPDADGPISFPLSEPGPYYTGKRTFMVEDPSRDGRQIRVTLLYPALRPEGSTGPRELAGTNRDPDLSGAPYPLILTGPDTGDTLLKTHLATHGFVMAIVRFPDRYDAWDLGVVDHPRDLLFALDQIASTPPEGLEGAIDADRVGVTGYSGEGFDALALSGVRIDPEFYLSYCAEAPTMEPPLSALYLKIVCDLAGKWDDLVAHAGEQVTVGDDGLWQAVTDERIRAVLPMAADGAWLFGKRGLATADRPVLMIQATEDSPFQPLEAAFIFEHLGTSEKYMVSFVGESHAMVFDPEPARRMNHFAVAFFGTYLQDKVEYRDYFSEGFVGRFDDLAWGVYEGE